MKHVFIAAADENSIASAVTTVLFDNAKEARQASEGLSRTELLDRVDALLNGEGGTDERAVNTALNRLTKRLRKYNDQQAPILGITRLSGPTRNQRKDTVNTLWLDVEVAQEWPADRDRIGSTFRGDITDAGGENAVARVSRAIEEGKPREVFIATSGRGSKRMMVTWVLLLTLTMAVAAIASPRGQRFLERLVDAIWSSGSLPELLQKLRVSTDEAVFVAPGGARSPVALSGGGSEVRLSPGASRGLMHIKSSISDRDFSRLMELIVPLSNVRQVGVNAVQYREAAHEPIVPWVIEVLVAPQQDAELAAELAARKASISIRYDPPLPKPDLARLQDVSLAGKRITMTSELRELPHVQQTYAVTATVIRESRTSHEYRAHLTVDAKGLATLQRERGDPITAVSQDVKVGHPICTTILHEQTYPLNNPGQMDYVWALANMHEEQRAMLFVYPLSKSPWVDEITVDWGDGGKADQQKQKGLFTVAHSYRVGDRAYPITIYFKGSDVVYKFDLFVFKGRGPARRTSVVEYVTPYPPNPEVTSLTEMKIQDSGEVFVSMRQGPVTSESITFSLFHEPWAWAVRISRRTGPRVNVRYVWRDGEVVELPSVSPRSIN